MNTFMRFTADRKWLRGDVISGENLKTIEGYVVLNFEVASFSSFQGGPPTGGAVRNAASLIPQRLSYIRRSENLHALPGIDSHGRVDCDNNTTPAIYVMQISV